MRRSAVAVALVAFVAACGARTDEDPMNRRYDPHGQQTTFDPSRLQSFVTWGGGQRIANFVAPAPGSIFVFPAQPGLVAFPLPPGGIATLDQLVDVRYERPTTFTVSLYAYASTAMPNTDAFGVTWSVRTSVGAATNDLTFLSQFISTGGGTAPGAPPQSVLTTFQLAAHALQITPTLVNYSMTSAGTRQSLFGWSAWVAPVFE